MYFKTVANHRDPCTIFWHPSFSSKRRSGSFDSFFILFFSTGAIRQNWEIGYSISLGTSYIHGGTQKWLALRSAFIGGVFCIPLVSRKFSALYQLHIHSLDFFCYNFRGGTFNSRRTGSCSILFSCAALLVLASSTSFSSVDRRQLMLDWFLSLLSAFASVFDPTTTFSGSGTDNLL